MSARETKAIDDDGRQDEGRQDGRPIAEASISVSASVPSTASISASASASLVSSRFLRLIPRDFAREHLLVSQGELEGDPKRESLLVSADTSPFAIHNAAVRLQMRVVPTLSDPETIARVLDEAYAASREKAALIGGGAGGSTNGETDSHGDPSDLASLAPFDEAEVERLVADADRDLLRSQGKAPVVRLVDALFFEALSKGASDVHVQPLEDKTIVRYRVDGLLLTARSLPRSLAPAVVSRIKVMGKMDIAESRVPQDGRASVTIGSRPIDLRISTLPTSHGERAVVRLLDNKKKLSEFSDLGMPDDVAARYLERAGRAHGIVLLTGPTGSGKTTTLYATLRRIGSPSMNLMTIEDPIEYELSSSGLAISQAQVNEKKGVTFATGLRHILRQDPDVIMVGEIRDQETARIAIQSSLTGHLVFSTLHTNDAPSALHRLFDLGVEPYLVAASLSAVCAQRLVRRVHRSCRGVGCDACLQTGYLGRTGLFELLIVDDAIRDLVARRAPLSEIREAAKSQGMRTLEAEGERLVKDGETTREEVSRVVQGAE